MALIGVRETPLIGLNAAVKRLIDIVGSLLLLIVLSPLLLTLVAIIRLTSKGPAVFVQERVGTNGRLFRYYKFRSMARGQRRLDPSRVRPGADPRRGCRHGRRRRPEGAEDCRRPARYEGRPLHSEVLPRRTAPVGQRTQGRHEPGRPPPLTALRGGGPGRLAPQTPGRAPRPDRPVAGFPGGRR